MMTQIPDVQFLRGAVIEIQRALRVLSAFYPEIDSVSVDGLFGSATRRAVSQFQAVFGLPVTGVVDERTWDSLMDAQRDVLVRQAADRAATADTPEGGFALGDVNNSIHSIQAAFNELSFRTENFDQLAVNGVIDPLTDENIRRLQRTSSLTQTGQLDAFTLQALTRLRDALVNLEKLPPAPWNFRRLD